MDGDREKALGTSLRAKVVRLWKKRGRAMSSQRQMRKAGGRTKRHRSALPIRRPRDMRIDSEVVTAVLDVLKSGKYRAVTIDGIARQLARARSSVYRRCPSKRHLVAHAVVSELGDNPATDTGHIRGDLEAAVGTLLRAFRGPLGRALAGLVADMAQDTARALKIRRRVLAPRRRSMREALDRGTIAW